MLFALSDLRGEPSLSRGISSPRPSRLGTAVDLQCTVSLSMKQVLYQTWNECVKDRFRTSSLRFQKQPVLNTALCAQRIPHPRLHVLGNIQSRFCRSHAAPSNNFFPLSLLAIFIISTVVIQSDPCCAKCFANMQKDSVTSCSPQCPEPAAVTRSTWAAFAREQRGLRGGEDNFSPNCPCPQCLYSRKEGRKKQCCEEKTHTC